MSVVVQPSRYVEVPEHLRGRIVLERIHPEWETAPEATYEVYLRPPNGDVPAILVGTVRKRRTESWRMSANGQYRTSLRGRPIHWDAVRTSAWRPPGTFEIDCRIGYRHPSRAIAAVSLVEAYLEAVHQ